jgi:hypothetical protein
VNESGTALLDRAAEAGSGIADSVTDAAVRLGGDLLRLARSAGAAMSCSDPDPHACWLPTELPPIIATVDDCRRAKVRFQVHNCGLATRTVFVAATGRDAKLAVGAPASATIGALETAEIVAELTLPDDATSAELVLWVRGCSDTAVRWTVRDSGRRTSTCKIMIDDCPRTRHSWCDHFAQPGRCQGQGHD